MLPMMARFQDNKEQLQVTIRRTLSVSVFVISPVMTTIAVVAAPLITIIFTEKWIACVPFMQMCCIACLFTPLHRSNLQAFNAIGRSDIFLKLEIVKVIVNLALLAIAVLFFKNLYAVAAALIVAGALSVFINAYPAKRLLGYGPIAQIRDVLPAYALSALCATVALPVALVIANPWLLLAGQTVIIMGLYCLFARAFKMSAFSFVWTLIKDRFFSSDRSERQES
jgi:O-antigen/teichoic acid export membrane protein